MAETLGRVYSTKALKSTIRTLVMLILTKSSSFHDTNYVRYKPARSKKHLAVSASSSDSWNCALGRHYSDLTSIK
jgi:hypothetical protein